MRILFIGHSLIEFFDWQERFPGHSAVNLGVAGETTEGLLARLEQIVRTNPSADLLFLMTGLNNIAMDDFDFLDSYQLIIHKLSASYPKARIFVNSILPTLHEFIDNKAIENSNRDIRKIADESRAGYIDAYALFVDSNNQPAKEYFSPDCVHLSDGGYRAWSGAMEKIILG